MNYTSKFAVNDLVQHKFQKGGRETEKSKAVSAYEVIDVTVHTCMAGSQIWYDCRPLFRVFTTEYSTTGKETKLVDIAHGIVDNRENKYVRFREDELKECPKDIIDQINQSQ